MNEVEERTQTAPMTEAEFKTLLKREISRLIEGRIAPEDIDDDEPLFTIPGECESRIELDSLDALELAFAIEEATGQAQLEEWKQTELLTLGSVTKQLRRNAATVDGGAFK
jgi:hypothetical protein